MRLLAPRDERSRSQLGDVLSSKLAGIAATPRAAAQALLRVAENLIALER